MKDVFQEAEVFIARQPATPRTPVPFEEKSLPWMLGISGLWLLFASISIWRYTWDDSYIIFRYAQNFANGQGPIFNLGQKVEGYTSFLWVVLLAGATRVSVNPVLASKILGLLFNLAALAAGYFLARLLGRKIPMYGVGLLLAACNAHFVEGSVAGLETPLFTALLSWSTVAYLQANLVSEESSRNRHLLLASVLFALLVMTRPDGVLAYSLMWVHAAWKFRGSRRTLAIFTLPFLVLYAPYFAWRWHYYGFFFPNTFYVKRGGTLALFALGLIQTAKFLGDQAGGWFLGGLVVLTVMMFPAVDTTIPSLAIASRVFFELWSGGVTQGEFRFLIPTLPLMWILAERVVLGAVHKVEREPRGLLLLAGVSTLMVAVQVGNFIHYRKQKIEPVRAGMERAHIGLGEWLGQHTPPSATIAVGDIGAIGFTSHRQILDIDGLVDAHIAHLPGSYGERQDPQYVLQQAPEFIVLRTSSCTPTPADVSQAMDRAVFSHPQFRSAYAKANCWEFWPGYDLVLYQRGTWRGLIEKPRGEPQDH